MTDRKKESMKKYRSSQKFKDWQKEYRKKRLQDPAYHDKIKTQKRDNRKLNFVTGMLKAASTRAAKYGISFELKKEDIVIPKLCPILEIEIIPGDKDNYLQSPSLDRLDNSKGYTKDNVRVISSLANTMKNCATKEQLLKFCENIPKYLR
jgi:hypothetical protein